MGSLAGIAVRDGKRSPMKELDRAEVTLEHGIQGDFRGRPGGRQVTLLSSDDWRMACDDVGRELPWTARRANLLVDDVELPRDAGAIVEVGPVRLEVAMETEPCSRMDEQCPGLREALLPDWRGGVACRVLSGGSISRGDAVRVVASSKA